LASIYGIQSDSILTIRKFHPTSRRLYEIDQLESLENLDELDIQIEVQLPYAPCSLEDVSKINTLLVDDKLPQTFDLGKKEVLELEQRLVEDQIKSFQELSIICRKWMASLGFKAKVTHSERSTKNGIHSVVWKCSLKNEENTLDCPFKIYFWRIESCHYNIDKKKSLFMHHHQICSVTSRLEKSMPGEINQTIKKFMKETVSNKTQSYLSSLINQNFGKNFT